MDKVSFYDIKSISTSEGVIKDIDEAKGIVTGYFSIFGNLDSDGDMVMPGAFKRTLQNNGRRIKHLYQHDPFKPLSGKNNDRLILMEDNKGLYFESTISKTSWGKDAIQLYVDGVMDEHSIGYNVLDEQKSQSGNELRELRLWEGSSVTWGANEQAGTSGVKSMNKEQCFTKMNNVLKAIKNGKYENEELFEALEIYFKQLQQHIEDLTAGSTQPAVKAPDSQKGFEDSEMLLLKTTIEQQKLKLLNSWN
jgi:HK97 family phage prohead protease